MDSYMTMVLLLSLGLVNIGLGIVGAGWLRYVSLTIGTVLICSAILKVIL